MHLIKMQRKPSGSYKSDQPPHSPIIRTNCKEAALLKFKTMSCHNSLISNLGIGSLKKSFRFFYKQNIYLVRLYNKITVRNLTVGQFIYKIAISPVSNVCITFV